MNILLAAASSSKNAPILLERSGLSKCLDVVVGGNDFLKSKPDPEIFSKACRRLKAIPSHCVVIEDSAIGVILAKNAYMKTIGVLSSKDTKIKELTDLTINSLKNHKSIINFLLFPSEI